MDQQRSPSRALRLLAVNPRAARLRTRKLEGGDCWACRYAYDGRIVSNWAGDLITLLDLGTHDEVY